jgi:ribokinase
MLAVVGALNLDLVAQLPRLPRAGETVLGHSLARHAGGKGGNQAVAAARLGAPVRFFGAVGVDPEGQELIASLANEGIDVHAVLRVAQPSGCAWVQVADDGENSITVLPGANELAPLPPLVWPSDLQRLMLQLELPLPTVMAWANAARQAGVPVLLNAAPALALPSEILRGLDCLLVNEVEARALCDGEVPALALAALAALGPRRVVVTLGSRGALAWDEGRTLQQMPHDVWMTDSTGAGDTFAGALAAALWQGRPFDEALRRAGVAAALACTRRGARTGMPTALELEAVLR